MRVLRKLKANTSCGPDGLPPNLQKKLAAQIAFPLSVLFNNSMSMGKIPHQWRRAIVTPIPKGGLASAASNYRHNSMQDHGKGHSQIPIRLLIPT